MIPEDGWYRITVPVRFRDLDSLGHAHHTLPLIYLEEARAAFWRELRGTSDAASIDYVMAEVKVRYHARIVYPAELTVALAVRRVGDKSFTTDFEIRNDGGGLLSSGSAVQVSYDYESSRPKPLDQQLRALLGEWAAAAAHDSASEMAAETRPMIPPSR